MPLNPRKYWNPVRSFLPLLALMIGILTPANRLFGQDAGRVAVQPQDWSTTHVLTRGSSPSAAETR